MGNNLKELHRVEDLNIALTESGTRPVLFFKHSLTCPISTRALKELESHLSNADSRVSYKLITVQTARAVSDEVASRLKIEHQSPQAILVRNGRQLWNASHYDITVLGLEEAIRDID